MTDGPLPVLGSLDPTSPAPFHQASALRRVAGEPIVNLLYPRALTMEVAHPSVAAAVAEHSHFQQRPLSRLWATSDAAMRLVFGQGAEPMEAAQHIYRIHDRINGTSGGVAYTAHDASLLLWVWATLVDTFEVAFTRWVRPYRPGEAEEFYQDMARFARFFGIPDRLVPADRDAFAAYLDGVLAGDLLGSTATSARMVREVLWFERWYLPQPVGSALRILAVGTLDDRLADRLDVALDAGDHRRFDRLDRGLRRHYTRLPVARTDMPYLYLGVRRSLSSAQALFSRSTAS
ncbi:MAG TPA: oxygenase MpaB family protein [Acidimicrobiales bacterium]|nr:oxygenase MpaB family protein [Acidimicrobiales bacterium]